MRGRRIRGPPRAARAHRAAVGTAPQASTWPEAAERILLAAGGGVLTFLLFLHGVELHTAVIWTVVLFSAMVVLAAPAKASGLARRLSRALLGLLHSGSPR